MTVARTCALLFALISSTLPAVASGQDTTPPTITSVSPAPINGGRGQDPLSTLSMQFSEDVIGATEALTLWTPGDSILVAGTDYTATYDAGTTTLTVVLASPIVTGRLTARVDYTTTDAAGNPLDGEIDDPRIGATPSGNGAPGGPAVFHYHVLQGDINADRVVDSNDDDLLKAAQGTCDTDPDFDRSADLNDDGCVNVLDVFAVESGRGGMLADLAGNELTIDARTPQADGVVRGFSFDTIEVTFDSAIRPELLSERSLWAVAPDDSLLVPDSVQLLDGDTRAVFTFSPAMDLGGEYFVGLDNGLATTAGRLLVADVANWISTLDFSPAEAVVYSPRNGEDGVALTRETEIDFDFALDPNTVSDVAFFATFAGATLPARVQTSADNKTVYLFYDDPLPPSALVRVTVFGDALLDDLGNVVDGDGDGIAGGTGTFDFETLSLTTLPGTAVCGRVFASELEVNESGDRINVPLEGATITVDGAEDTLFTVTDAMGNFRLEPAPVGRFFVHIDGRTATVGVPEGAYYPFVGKTWTSKAGVEVNVGNVYLPLVPDGTLQPVSDTVDTEITFAAAVLDSFPELTGVSINVPAGSLFADDGTVGGSVGIAPVPPDRLPGQLPPELDFPLVITVQTDGPTNFDQPVPVRFPNLPDPETGEVLGPGEKSALLSFDHDKGYWELQGSMTVSEDGLYVETDPGVGIRAPGWHGESPLSETSGTGGGCADDATAAKSPLGVAKDGQSPCDVENESCDDEKADLDAATTNLAVDVGMAVFFSGAAGLSCSALVPTGGLSGLACGGSLTAAVAATAQALKSNADYKAAETKWANCIGASAFNGGRGIGALSNRATADADSILPVIDELLSQLHAVLRASLEEYEQYASVSDSLVSEIDRLVSEVTGGNREGFLSQIALIATGAQELSPSQLQFPRVAESFYVATSSVAVYDTISIDDPDSILVLPSVIQTISRGRTDSDGSYRILSSSEQPPEAIHVFSPTQFEFGGSRSPIAAGDLALSATAIPAGDQRELRPYRLLSLDGSADDDGDSLPDVAEFVIGTNSSNHDTDGDGISDGAEVQQGTDPLDGIPAATGILYSADTPGTAQDVCAVDDLVIVADGSAGVSVFNVFNGMDPTIIAQVDTPGEALSVTCARDRIAVADGSAGLAIIDVTDPPAGSIVDQITASTLGGNALSVAASGGLIDVGTSLGDIVTIDVATGAVVQRVTVASGAPIYDLSVSGETLYAATSSAVYGVGVFDDPRVVQGPVSVTSGFNPDLGRKRIFAGPDAVHAAHVDGFDAVGLFVSGSTPPADADVFGTSSQAGWKHIVSNGSGLGIAAAGPNAFFSDGGHDVQIYDLTNPLDPAVTIDSRVITAYETPGVAHAVALYNGLAYVADGTAGLQVINYQAFDIGSVPPAAGFTTSDDDGVLEEGELLLVQADVTDDVLVRTVELRLDGETIASDGNAPFEFRINVPTLESLGATGDSLTVDLSIRAADTGGNTTESTTETFTLIRDVTAPALVESSVESGAAVPSALLEQTAIVLRFDDALDPTTVTTASVLLTAAGPDSVLDTVDDVSVPISLNPVRFGFEYVVGVDTPAFGLQRLTLDGSTITDASGNLFDGDGDGVAGGDLVIEFDVFDSPFTKFWISAISGEWTDPANWTGGTVPGPSDLVFIDVPDLDATVTISSTSASAAEIESNEPIVVQNATLTVLGEIRSFGGLQFQNGANLVAATLPVGIPAVSVTGTSERYFEDVVIDADISLSTFLEARGATQLNGQIDASLGYLYTRNGETLQGTGTIQLDQGQVGGSRQVGDLTIGEGLTVRGRGFIGNASVAVHVLGTVQAATFGSNNLGVSGASVEIPGSMICTGGNLTVNNLTGDVGPISFTGNGAVILGGEGYVLTKNVEVPSGGKLICDGIDYVNAATISTAGGSIQMEFDETPGRIANLGDLRNTDGSVTVFGTVENDSTVWNLDTTTGSWNFHGELQGGSIATSGGSRLTLVIRSFSSINQDFTTLFDGVSIAGGEVNTSDSVMLEVTESFAVDGILRLERPSTFDVSAVDSIGGAGRIQVSNQSGAINEGGRARITSSASTLTIGQGLVVQAYRGQVEVPSGTLVNAGTIEMLESDVIAPTIINEGTIRHFPGGAGNLAVTGQGENRGTLALSTTGRTMEWNGDLVHTSTGRVTVPVNSASSFGQLSVSGTTTLAGEIELTFGGYVPADGASFDLIDYTSATGDFDALSSSDLDATRTLSSVVGATLYTVTASEVTPSGPSARRPGADPEVGVRQ